MKLVNNTVIKTDTKDLQETFEDNLAKMFTSIWVRLHSFLILVSFKKQNFILFSLIAAFHSEVPHH